MKKFLFSLILLSGCCLAASAQYTISDQDKARAEAIVSLMTLEEKCLLVTGQVDGFHTAKIARLGIPSVRMADGPQGVRNKTNSTYYPCGLSLAAAFNRETANGVGTGIGYDASARGVRIMLCPGVNIYRSPLCGRNFEYYGEDPFLASETAVQYISGIQSQRVMATIKHFAVNNQEWDRHWGASIVDERTLNEIYFPTFRKAVEQAKVGAVMTSYNPVNGTHAAENNWLIGQLRKWGHDGIVMSDWKSTYTTLGCLTSGLDLEMPQGFVMNYDAVKGLVENGMVSEKLLDEKCAHILQAFIAYGLLDQPMKDKSIPEDYEVSRANAYSAAKEGPVMLTNNGILPIKGAKKNNIVVLGPNAEIVPFGGGSGKMDPIEGRNITVAAGLQALDQKKFKTTVMDYRNINEAVLAKATAVVLCVGFTAKTEKEGSDRTYSLPEGQNELIAKVAAINPKTIVLVNSGGEVDIQPWMNNVASIIMAWYPGQEGGRAIADIVSGKISPSGKLPFTFWGSEEKNPTFNYYHAQVPEITKISKHRDPYPFAEYREGVFVGYRAVGRKGIQTPLFPFGFGLSYATFEYSDGSVSEWSENGVTVSFTVKNTSKVEGSEAAQVYVAPQNPGVPRPAKELKGFDKVKLAKGASQTISITLPADAFKYYDADKHDWVLDKGSYKILVGSSSEDIRLEMPLKVL